MSCKKCSDNQAFLARILLKIDRQMDLMVDRLMKERPPQQKLRDADYVMDRIGISPRTLFRKQSLGLIPVAETIKGRRFYRDEDVEQFRKGYRK